MCASKARSLEIGEIIVCRFYASIEVPFRSIGRLVRTRYKDSGIDYRHRLDLGARRAQPLQSPVALLSTHDGGRLAGLCAGAVWNIPLHGLWAVLTAVVVTQISVGGSLHATTDYVLGTIGGVIYAAAIAVLIPHRQRSRWLASLP